MHFEQRQDVRKVAQFWDTPIPNNYDKLVEDISFQFSSVLEAVRMPQMMPQMISLTHEANWQAGQPDDIRQLTQIELPSADEISVVLDKNTRQRAFASQLGYYWRCAKNYLDDPDHYELCHGETVDTFLRRKAASLRSMCQRHGPRTSNITSHMYSTPTSTTRTSVIMHRVA